jgi:hypothetical protein
MTLKTFVKELTHLPRNSFMDFGWGNGYVVISEGHPMHGKHYDEIPVEVNGGLTYAESVSNMGRENWPELPEGVNDNDWVVGFDTAHSWDTLSRWPKEKVERETKRLRLQLEKLGK